MKLLFCVTNYDFFPVDQCMSTPMGLGYRGAEAKSQTNQKCKPWQRVPVSLRPQTWSFGNISESNPDDLQSEGRFCRNPDNDIKGVWCITDIKIMQMEYCKLPYCRMYLHLFMLNITVNDILFA